MEPSTRRSRPAAVRVCAAPSPSASATAAIAAGDGARVRLRPRDIGPAKGCCSVVRPAGGAPICRAEPRKPCAWLALQGMMWISRGPAVAVWSRRLSHVTRRRWLSIRSRWSLSLCPARSTRCCSATSAAPSSHPAPPPTATCRTWRRPHAPPRAACQSVRALVQRRTARPAPSAWTPGALTPRGCLRSPAVRHCTGTPRCRSVYLTALCA